MVLRITDNTEIRNSTQKGVSNGTTRRYFGQSSGRVDRCRAQASGGGLGSGNSLLKSLLPVVLEILINRQGGSGGGLANVLGGMLGGGGGNAAAGGLVGAALGGLLGGSGGTGGASGLGALLEQFQRAGFAEQATSWVGSGQNLPISPRSSARSSAATGCHRLLVRSGQRSRRFRRAGAAAAGSSRSRHAERSDARSRSTS
jgi:uncharacterized protein YidB (DUF937 family)